MSATDFPINNLFNLVETLLSPANIRRALKPLNREQIELLKSHDFDVDPATTSDLLKLGLLGLQDEKPVTLKPVATVLKQLATASKTTPASSAQIALEKPDASDSDFTAFTGTQKSVLLLQEIARRTPTLNQSGAVPAALSTQLGEDFMLEPTEVNTLLTALRHANILTSVAATVSGSVKNVLSPTDSAASWAYTDHAARWLWLAARILASAPNVLGQNLDADTNLISSLRTIKTEHPLLDFRDIQEIESFVYATKLLGITVNGEFVPAIKMIFAGKTAEALELAEQNFPDTVPGIIVQPDFSVIIAGPLEPKLGLPLLKFARIVTPGLATTLQITPSSLRSAISQGFPPTEITEFLTEISLSPLPQPLTFLLADLAGSHDPSKIILTTANKLLKPKPAPSTGELLEKLAEIRQTTSRLSELSKETAKQILAESRANPQANVLNMLEVARQARTPVNVTMLLDGNIETYLLTPVSISKDRFRAIDVKRERELVLPLRAIQKVNFPA